MNIPRLGIVLALLLLTIAATAVRAEPLRFAVVPPAAQDEYYLPARQGCQDAALELGGVECLYAGPPRFDPQAQDKLILKLLDDGLDGLAVAAGDSGLLASSSLARARDMGVPVVTFGTDLSAATLAENPGLRLLFVGTDDREFGYRLGAQARRFRPNGGTLCVIAGAENNPGQNLRVQGVHEALLGFAPERWKRAEHCPLFSDGNPVEALDMLLGLVKNDNASEAADTVVVVGDWPQREEREYEQEMERLKSRLESNQVVVVVAGTRRTQLHFLGMGLAHGNVGEDTYAMGRKAMEMLLAIHAGQATPRAVRTPITTCSGGLAPFSVLCFD